MVNSKYSSSRFSACPYMEFYSAGKLAFFYFFNPNPDVAHESSPDFSEIITKTTFKYRYDEIATQFWSPRIKINRHSYANPSRFPSEPWHLLFSQHAFSDKSQSSQLCFPSVSKFVLLLRYFLKIVNPNDRC